jgi:hypothetical protein
VVTARRVGVSKYSDLADEHEELQDTYATLYAAVQELCRTGINVHDAMNHPGVLQWCTSPSCEALKELQELL